MKTATETRHILDQLEGQHPGADTELHYRNAFELLVATILSAQSTDQRVNMVTPALFARYPDACALSAATTDELEPQIHSTGFFRAKSKSLVGMARALMERHDGQVPADMSSLTELPGVGRKTANVVLGHALGVPGLPVDRHIGRAEQLQGPCAGRLLHQRKVVARDRSLLRRKLHVAIELPPEHDAVLALIDFDFRAGLRPVQMLDGEHLSAPSHEKPLFPSIQYRCR